MKRTILWFLLSVLVIGSSFAQQTFKVQGHPRPDIKIKEVSHDKYGSTYDASFTMDNIKFWVGKGENRAAFVIDWYDGKGGTLVWGYRWDKGTTAYGVDMIEAIAKADARFTYLQYYTGPGLGTAIGGLGYDVDNQGSRCLLLEGNATPQCPVDGVVSTADYNFDDYSPEDPNDHWQSGWYTGYWSYQIKDSQDADFSYSGLGASSRVLVDGSWDGWSYSDFSGMGGTIPRTPYIAALPPAVSVASVSLSAETLQLYTGEAKQLGVTILPEDATNKNVSWTSSNTAIATVDANGLVTAVAEGTAEITVTVEDGEFSDMCAVTIEKLKYDDGVFFVNEDWFGHNNGSVNFLDKYNNWHYRVYQKENPGKELGSTSQYGAIYGDKFFIVSKQAKDPGDDVTGSRLAVCDAETMLSLAEFTEIGGADGRSFLGVDEHKGYISTSDGIHIFDIDNLRIDGKVEGTDNGTSGLYTGQVGTMIRAADKVFAVHQQKGLLVIDIENDRVESVISAPIDDETKQRGFGSIVQSKDGSLWLSVATNVSGSGGGEEYMLKLNPYTLETTRVELPKGASVPNSWYAWTADGFCASTQSNKLYWKNNGGWFNSTKIYEYDIDNNTTTTLIDFSTYEPSESWGIYGAGFRLDPRTDDIYVSLYQSFGSSIYKVVKITPSTATVVDSYPMEANYWFPAMPVFPDKYAPVVSDQMTDITVDKETTIYLGDKISDLDNTSVSIVKSIVSISDESILTAIIKGDNLLITPTYEASGTSNIELKFNSNGKVVTKSIAITVEIRAVSVELNVHALSLSTNATSQLTATVLPENATNKNVNWASSNTDVATVSNTGLVTAIAAGNATITATTEDGNLSDACTVTVEIPVIAVASVELNSHTLKLETNNTHQLVANVLPENATNKYVRWASSNLDIATVNADGIVTAISKGDVIITVTTEDGDLSDSCTVTVEMPVIAVISVELNSHTLTLNIGETSKLTATILPDNATNKGVTWISSNTDVVTVSIDGLITAITKGSATITVITEDGNLSDICEVEVGSNGVNSPEINNIRIYPTITTGMITIVQTETIEKVQIFNISGQLVQTLDIQSSECTVDISSYTPGLYIVRVGDNATKVIKK